MSRYITFTIGSSDRCDVQLGHSSVSDIHAELVITKSGKLFLTDRKSSAGSFKKEKNKWVNFTQTYINKSTELKFGDYKTSGESVLELIAPNGINAKFEEGNYLKTGDRFPENQVYLDTKADLPTGQVRRSVHTGEIISAKEK